MRTIVNRILGRRLISAEDLVKKQKTPSKRLLDMLASTQALEKKQKKQKQKLPGQLPLPFTEK